MGDSKRQKIVDAVITRLKLINGTGDYTSNVGNRVFDNPITGDQASGDLPFIGVYDLDAIATPSSTGRTYETVHAMAIGIRGFCARGLTSSAANARNLIKDIQTAIRQDDKWTVTGVPLAMQTRQVRDGIARSNDTFEVDGCEVEIEVQFKTLKFNAEA